MLLYYLPILMLCAGGIVCTAFGLSAFGAATRFIAHLTASFFSAHLKLGSPTAYVTSSGSGTSIRRVICGDGIAVNVGSSDRTNQLGLSVALTSGEQSFFHGLK
jgi:hypothetical protein